MIVTSGLYRIGVKVRGHNTPDTSPVSWEDRPCPFRTRKAAKRFAKAKYGTRGRVSGVNA